MREINLEQLAEMYIEITDKMPNEDVTNRVMFARQSAFQILINAATKRATQRKKTA